MQCFGITHDRKTKMMRRCKNKVNAEEEYCGVHKCQKEVDADVVSLIMWIVFVLFSLLNIYPQEIEKNNSFEFIRSAFNKSI
jgi:hypothetical protein